MWCITIIKLANVRKTITFIRRSTSVPNGVTEMDKYVGYPTGIAAKMTLEGIMLLFSSNYM